MGNEETTEEVVTESTFSLSLEFAGYPVSSESPLLVEGGEALRIHCRQEVQRFHEYLQKCGVLDYAQGLSDWEKLAIEGYLYQKSKGRF